ncbi:hypothetical protein Btru_046225 [Bulinus truncatus]|nr:hypothetical protein Btru_046225 [Bulinus truncatus]
MNEFTGTSESAGKTKSTTPKTSSNQSSTTLRPPNYCRLGIKEVNEALQFLPLNYTLGITEHNITVYYGYNGDSIEEGVVVIGSCYICNCSGNKLKCEVSNCEICPSSSIECKGACYSSHIVQTFSDVGVPEHCLNESKPCIPESCTTPHNCPGPWSSWTFCNQNCEQHRYRTCGQECGDDCMRFNLTETQICIGCVVTVPTTPICADNEKLSCATDYDICMGSCAKHRKNSSCDALLDDNSCTEQCICHNGLKRNAFGLCVPSPECECYPKNSTTIIPQNFTVNVSKCVSCECLYDDYICKERKDCCELHEWSEWSKCSATCGKGEKKRTRKSYGNGCPAEVSTIDTDECDLPECPCFYRNETWESGKVVKDRCEECMCHDGIVNCNKMTNIGNETWSDDGCTKKCFCNVNGSKECFDSHELQQCQKVINQCNLTTHVLEETEDACCKKCTPKMIPCGYQANGFVQLNVTRADHGICISGQLEVGSCFGTCGFDTDIVESTKLVDDTFELVTKQSCSCCKATTDKKSVPFSCADGSNVNYKVSYISGCSCVACHCKDFTEKLLERLVAGLSS